MNSIQRQNIHDFLDIVSSVDPKTFRQKQVIEWLYCKGVGSFEDMKNLPKALRESLEKKTTFSPAKIIESKKSSDSSTKHLVQLGDSSIIECVAIPAKGAANRLTACLSSQVGCAMGCCFCATGKLGFKRNLGFGEILEQVLLIEKEHGQKVANIVMMGQGEPLLNYDNVVAALEILNTFKPYEIGARKLCISTCGIISGIEKLSCLNKQYRLAVSLHSADQKTRNLLMPGLKKQSLAELKQSLHKYQEKTGRRISFEYVMLKDINDTEEQLGAFYNFLKGLKAHINLIPFNKVSGTELESSDLKTLSAWEEFFKNTGINISTRKSKGSDVFGACGQLANKH
ncbi:MAG: 23S rRNA (adenine(2503)-C(2))-methyltransferase RlmN [Enterococcus sp.]|nr:23S rRNA (adenine(2503)-C(2))-methyltransferase RlmN [Enterococcus sp.]